MRNVPDPISEDLAELDARADEADREQRWAEFINTLRTWTIQCLLVTRWLSETKKAYVYRDDPDKFGPGRLAWHIQQFAQSEGWPAVLQAIARAMREQAKA